jgi:hypothetical protein
MIQTTHPEPSTAQRLEAAFAEPIMGREAVAVAAACDGTSKEVFDVGAWHEKQTLKADAAHEVWKQAQAAVAAPVAAQPVPERDTMKPAEEQGLFHKYNVTRTDGSDKPGHKHADCECFVLDVEHDPHAKAALAAYAESIAATHPALAKDMVSRYNLPTQDVTAPGKNALGAAAEVCLSRSRSLSRDGNHIAANEAQKCAGAIRAAMGTQPAPAVQAPAVVEPLNAGYFYNAVIHAIMDVDSNHGGCKYRLDQIAGELEVLMRATPQPAAPVAPTVDNVQLWATNQETGEDMFMQIGPRDQMALQMLRMNDLGRDYWLKELLSTAKGPTK